MRYRARRSIGNGRCYDNRMDSPIALVSNRYTAGVTASVGGSLLWFGLRDQIALDFVRTTTVRALGECNARLTASYPLVPYSNRIGDGRFEFGGASRTLRRNADFSEHPIHGIGWLRSWTVVASSAGLLEIAIEHDGAGASDADWPWSFTARQVFALDDDGLRISIAVTNRDADPMPGGIGLHPFFPKSAATEIRFDADAVWMSDARMLPQSCVAVPQAFDFAQRRPVGDLDVDNCFAGWSGSAEILWHDKQWGLRIGATDVFRHLVVYTSPSRDSIAVEPVSHVNNAVNLARVRGDTGLRTLAPGATLEGTMTLSPMRLGAE